MSWANTSAGHCMAMAHSDSTSQNTTFNHFDPLAGLRDIIALHSALRPEATDTWFEIFSPWINAVCRKARLAISEQTGSGEAKTIDHITRKMIIKIVTDCQNHPEKAEYIGSLEHAVLEQVRLEFSNTNQSHSVTANTPPPPVARGSALDDIRRQLAVKIGRTPTRAEIVAAWNESKSQRA